MKYYNLKKVMDERGEHLKDIAKVINKSIGQTGQKVNGHCDWTISEVKAICEHYDKDFYELFT